MTKPLKIHFISDVSCPWCAVGWYSLQKALTELGGGFVVDVHFEPFELNPAMPAAGQNIVEHIGQKYGSSPEQSAQTREMIRRRAAEVGFSYSMDDSSRIYNTFDAHRLLHWAQQEGRQQELKLRLLAGYLAEARNPSDHDTLVELAADAGLDGAEARRVLTTGAYTDEVRRRQRHWTDRGVTSVPTIVFNDNHAVIGGQPPEVFEKVIKELATAEA